MAFEKKFQATVDGVNYEITYHAGFGLKNSYIDVNGQQTCLKNYPGVKSKVLNYLREYPVQLGNTTAILFYNAFNGKKSLVDLVINGNSVTTGEPYVSVEKMPGWTYVFLVLDLLWIAGGGAIPILVAFLAAMGTVRTVMSQRIGTGVKVLLCCVWFFLESFIILTIAISGGALYSMIGR